MDSSCNGRMFFPYIDRILGVYNFHEEGISRQDMSIPSNYVVAPFTSHLSFLGKKISDLRLHLLRIKKTSTTINLYARPIASVCTLLHYWLTKVVFHLLRLLVHFALAIQADYIFMQDLGP